MRVSEFFRREATEAAFKGAAFLRMQAVNARTLAARLRESCQLLEAELYMLRAEQLEDEAERLS